MPDDGDTLVEVLLAVTILAIASVALIIAFGTSIKASAEHRNLTNFDLVESNSSSSVSTVLQESANASTFFGQCQPVSAYNTALTSYLASSSAPILPANYTIAITGVSWWNGLSFGGSCSSTDWNLPQEITFKVTNLVTGIVQPNNQVVVDNPTTLQAFATVSSGTAAQLQFTTQPSGATINAPFAVQPVIEVENSSGQLVTSDLSPVILTLTGTGPTSAALSNTCVGVETSGVITFSNCSINQLGSGYTLTATDGSLPTATSNAFSVSAAQLVTPVITNVVPSTATTGAINVTYTGSSNAPTTQTYNIKACTDSAMSQNCVTQAAYVSGSDLTGLTAGATYYVQITAVASTGYLPATTQPFGPTLATVQLATPSAPSVNYGAQAGSLVITFTGSSNAPTGQIYTVLACTSSAMTGTGCVTQDGFASGSTLSGLNYTAGVAGITYYVEVSADASPGYLQSQLSTYSSHADTSQVPTPTALSTASSASQTGAITASFTEPSGAGAPSSFTAIACPSGSTSGCVTTTGYTSGAQLSGLVAGTNYTVTITAVSTNAAYASATSAVVGPALASIQLLGPTGASVGYGTVAGSVTVNFTAPTTVAAGQTYTVTACTNVAMTAGCVTNTNYGAGTNVTGLTFSAGTPGATYYVTVSANASTGFLASVTSTQASGPETSQIGVPGTPTVASSSSSAGALVATFAASPGVTPSSYTATACTNAAMTANCVTQANYMSGAQFTGVSANTSYYVTITAVPPSAAYVANTTSAVGPTLATVQLAAPTNVSVGYGTVAGSIAVTFTAPSPAAGSQTYTLLACTNTAMSTGCVTNGNYVAGANLSGLAYTAGTAGTTYYVTITANASSGYLVSPASTQVSGPDTSQIGTPGTPTVASSTTTAGAVVITFTASTPTPSSYTAVACTNTGMSTGCVTHTGYTSGSQFTGLVAGSSYYVDVFGVGTTGYVTSATSAVSTPSAVASTQLGTPTISAAASSSTTAGAVTIIFSAGSPVAGGQTYTATGCTNAGMTIGCITQSNYTSGSQFTGLVAGTTYYLSITANGSTGYVQATTIYGTAVLATVQLAAPTNVSVGYGTVAGSIAVTFTAPSPAAGSQTYTLLACTNTAMSTGCVTNGNYVAGANLSGLAYTAGTAGTTYYVTVVANAATSYLVSPASSQVSGPDTGQIGTPGTPSATSSTTSAGAIVITFASSSGPAPSSYTAVACTNTGMSTGCVTHTGYTSGSQFTGLVVGSSYYVDVTGVASTGYVNSAVSSVSTTPAVASTQLGTPTISSAAPSTTTAGAVTITFSAGSPVASGQTYTATGCTNAGMTTGCVTQSSYTSGSQFTGLTPNTTYYLSITANGSTGYVQATTIYATPVLATVQLAVPTNVVVGYGTTAGSIIVTFTEPSPSASGQTFTVKACTNSGMTNGCQTGTIFVSGAPFTGLPFTSGAVGTTYYVTASANASSGYLGSGISTPVSGPETSQIGTPGTPTGSTGSSTGNIVINFSSSSGTAPASYTALACLTTAMNTGCVTHTGYTSGSQFTGLVSGTYYYVNITAVGPTGYVNATSATSSASIKAK